MSEEEAKANAATAEETPATNGGSRPKERKPRDETPIEELYDLSQPIPKVRFIKCQVIVA